MAQRAEILTSQEEIAACIRRMIINMKKDSSARKTADYINNRRTTLQQLWADFNTNHSEIMTVSEDEHPYFKNKYFQQTKTMYEEGIALLNKYETALPAPTATAGQTSGSGQGITTGSNGRQTQLTKLQIKMNALQSDIQEVQMKVVDGCNKDYCEYHVKSIKEDWKEIRTLNEELLAQGNYNNDEVNETKKMVDEVIEKLYQNQEAQGVKSANHVVLPTLKIPVFEGSYEAWTTFHDIFKRVIHENSRISKAEKMHYLKSHLRGDAGKLIQHLEASEANYESAWLIIRNRFDNTRLLLAKYLDNILNLSVLTYESAEGIKKIHDTTTECLKAIQNIGITTSDWGPIICHIVTRKLDKETNRLYEQSLTAPREVQELDQLLMFLETRFQSLEALQVMYKTEAKKHASGKPYEKPQNRWSVKMHHVTEVVCSHCKGSHSIYACQKFANLRVAERWNFIRSKKLCSNCLMHGEKEKCFSQKRCMNCDKKHHTLLHENVNKQHQQVPNKKPSQPMEKNVTSLVGRQHQNILLATALIRIRTVSGGLEYLRALVDSGSQASFITEEAAQILGLPKQKVNVQISGLGKKEAGTARGRITVNLRPRFPSDYQTTCELLILPRLTKTLPEEPIKAYQLQDWKNMELADPMFYKPGPIDVILGADTYKEIIMDGVQKFEGGLLAQNTELGWIISGNTTTAAPLQRKILSMVACSEEDKQLTKFWELEEVETNTVLSDEDKECEEHYDKTHSRNSDGTYTVQIPFKGSIDELGDSRKKAIARFLQLEKRLQMDEGLGRDYREFIKEYMELQHMEPVQPVDQAEKVYFIPHQPVIKEDSTTTKLRVVFDASSKTNTGISLNQLMFSGPRLQQDLRHILLRWRKHRIAFSADIEKMYRQIKIASKDQDLQRIVWRYSPDQPIREYKLTTVTYGTTAAPYLAVRTLLQLAKDEQQSFPRAAEVVTKDFYVDDLMSGTDTLEEAKELQAQLISLMGKGGFTLRKWTSNSTALIEELPEELKDKNMVEIDEGEVRKTLGIHWSPRVDGFKFYVSLSADKKPTKRVILSEISRIFDPLGWLAPVIVKAKLLIQQLWIQQQQWDQPVPEDILKQWMELQEQLPLVEQISIPRWIGYHNNSQKMELHAFCDASEKAYGAVIYSRIIAEDGDIHVTMLTAKSKVAPIKMKKTLPRLELCAASLLAKMVKETITALNISNIDIHAWSDSMITLAWIKGGPEKWKTFVSNRVAEIREIIPSERWRHVQSKDNPADAVSRGLAPSKLQQHVLWWNGPQWLRQEPLPLGDKDMDVTTMEESRNRQVQVLTVATEKFELLSKFSSWQKLLRVTAYCNRFIQRCKGIRPTSNHLTTSELNASLMQIVRIAQAQSWSAEIKEITMNKAVKKKNSLESLRPFLDSERVLRVGGRLQNSMLPYNEKHPILIPYDSHIAQLIIKDSHQRLLHAGQQVTAAFIRRKFWIINLKKAIRKEIHKCMKCLAFRGQPVQQLMGNLPKYRVTPSIPFSHTGLDYAGPIQIRTTKGRGHKSYKGYIAIFVCMATKAVHLEAVSDMTTNAFLAAFRRFTSRRGTCLHIYSDNGTTFVGANKVLQKDIQRIMEDSTVQENLTTERIHWHFIPPAAPHFGGIWEAAVKSTKYHLKRIVGNNTLTFEELSTVLYQIEACLNSRPLCPLSAEPNDVAALTPGHFLIGKELMTPNEPTADEQTGTLTRWKLVQKLRNDFWKIWSKEYLSGLQRRTKWTTTEENMEVGDLVLQKDENSPPSHWPLGRVMEVHPGTDGVVRVATIKTKGNTVLKRPLTKLVPLPREDTEERKEAKRTTSNVGNSAITNIITCLLTLSMIATPVQGWYAIKYPAAGLFIEDLGHAKLSRGDFRITLAINISSIQDDEKNINQTIQQMDTLCDNAVELSTESHCRELVHHLREQQKQVVWNMDIIQDHGSRSKRGLLGQLLTSVFGVNEEVYQDIDALEKNQQELITTSDHQTKLMLSTAASINETELRISEKLENFRKKLNDGLMAINEMQPWYRKTDDNKLNIHVLASYQMATNYLAEMESKYKRLLNAKFNRAHILDFIPTSQFSKIINNAMSRLSPRLELLTLPRHRMEMKMDNESINIFSYFHIAGKKEYNLIKPTPIPINKGNGTYASLDVPMEFLAIDYNSQTYFEISETKLKEMEPIGNQLYLCRPTAVRSIEHNPNCIIDEIYQRLNKVTCPMHQFTVRTLVWKQLYATNTWLFIPNQPTTAAVKCSGHREDVTVNKVGILQVSPDCTIHTPRTTLHTQLFTSIPVRATFTKPMDIVINTTVTNSGSINQIQLEEPVLLPSDQFHLIKEGTDELQRHQEHTFWHKIHNHPVAINTLATICIIIIGCTIWALWGYWRRNKEPSATQAQAEETFQLQPLPPDKEDDEPTSSTPFRPGGPRRMFEQHQT